ncbi:MULTISPECIES: hypothetical protein [unclassified Nodularia (in: cyanobacteria)]|uniref:hypothetical protein n=1 Tax=unclassified Nodularia (in: cyanobacteria) TaxID=2656917 RepID=UPI0018818523|nr:MULTISPECIES: hypothetical protein [unclassified Nodularia (in: cyanobacteria)]MBE9200351.1 hypothetical protein [Nodularia sp. LEGE 06071]MCC2695108.1 hypothetical protein [Nodularia sp. LEGE 04288]
MERKVQAELILFHNIQEFNHIVKPHQEIADARVPLLGEDLSPCITHDLASSLN